MHLTGETFLPCPPHFAFTIAYLNAPFVLCARYGVRAQPGSGALTWSQRNRGLHAILALRCPKPRVLPAPFAPAALPAVTLGVYGPPLVVPFPLGQVSPNTIADQTNIAGSSDANKVWTQALICM